MSTAPKTVTIFTMTRSKKSSPAAKNSASRMSGSRFSISFPSGIPKHIPLTKHASGMVVSPTASPFASSGRFSAGVSANPTGKANSSAQPMVLPMIEPVSRPTSASSASARASGHPPESFAMNSPAMTDGSMPIFPSTGVSTGAREEAIRGARAIGPIMARISAPAVPMPFSKLLPGPKRHPIARSAAPIRAKNRMIYVMISPTCICVPLFCNRT